MRPVLHAGDTLSLTVTLADYPAGAGWTLSYRLTPRAAGTPYSFNATASGDDHVVSVPAATTAAWVPGDYTCSAWVTHTDGRRATVESEGGQVVVRPDPATLGAGTDTRSDAERNLAAVKALLAGKATDGVASYQIAGRQLASYSLTELLKLRRQLELEVDAERLAAGLRPQYGGGGIRRILVRAA